MCGAAKDRGATDISLRPHYACPGMLADGAGEDEVAESLVGVLEGMSQLENERSGGSGPRVTTGGRGTMPVIEVASGCVISGREVHLWCVWY
eukprot:2804973-Rhodomonas_salina.1